MYNYAQKNFSGYPGNYSARKTKCGAFKAIDGEAKEENCKNCAYFSSSSCAGDVSQETSSLFDLYL